MKKILINLSLVLAFTFSGSVGKAAEHETESSATPLNLRCEYRTNPIGIDATQPNLSWQVSTVGTGWQQSAYQIMVASNPELLNEKTCDVWNSGIVSENSSVCIPYGGPDLTSQKRYYWKVRVMDTNGNSSSWSEPAYWEMGLLNPKEWTAGWIEQSGSSLISERSNIRWIWLANQDAIDVPRNTVASFKLSFNITELPKIVMMQTVARGDYKLYCNGQLVDTKKKEWQVFERQDLLGFLQKGENTVEVKVSAERTASFVQETGKPLAGRYAAFAGLLRIESPNGTVVNYPTNESWLSQKDGDSDWKKSKVAGELNEPLLGLDPGPLSEPAVMFRKAILLKKKIAAARLYVSALGSYRMFLNGQRVGAEVLTPEFTNYNKHVTYQAYDVTDLLAKGTNVVGSLLGDGWYGSPLGWNGEYDIFSAKPNSLIAELHVFYKDGTSETIVTDGSWKATSSAILKSEVYSGEFYDARLEQQGWTKPGFDDKTWLPVQLVDNDSKILSAQSNSPVKKVLSVKPVEIRKVGADRWILDMGQNLVGWLKIKVKGEAGTVVRMRFAEILKTNDSLYVDNLRGATATDCYVLNGKGEEVYEPHFTFHGFRYVEVTGFPGEPTEDAIVAEVISSVDAPTGFLETSSELVNKMYSLGIWGQQGNFLSVPTDCPQRDERLGYTGDGQVFWRTGTYNFDVAAFTHKWMKDVRDEQTVDGGFPNTAPAVPKSNRKNGSPGWEDAGVIVPWSSWMQYGDESIIRENWAAMVRYMDYVKGTSKDDIRAGGRLGDWLAPDPSTPNELISTGLWGMTAQMMAQMATAIGKDDEAAQYRELNQKIKAAFQQTFIAADGTVGPGSQTSYAIALHTGMVPDSLKETVTDKLVKAIESRDWHVSTGFLGTPYLLFALSDNGRADVAYRLLLNETFPSWGYMIAKGATTWWEHWDSDTGDPTMNSFNHYAFGSVVEWIYRAMAGINASADAPGFKKIIIRPVFDPTGKIDHAQGRYHSVYGEIVSEWQLQSDETVKLRVEIPANATATIVIPEQMKIEEMNNAKLPARNGEPIEVGSGVSEFVLTF